MKEILKGMTAEQVKYVEFLEEQAKRAVELNSTLRIKEWKLEQLKNKYMMEPKDWLVYYDYIANRWFPLTDEEREVEMAFAAAMAKRTIDCDAALDRFQKDYEEAK